MILCIDTTAIKMEGAVQKDLNLGDLISNHTEYFDSVKEALNNNYVPLDFSVSVRTLYSNEVLEIDSQTTDGSKKKLYYTNLTEIQRFIHRGYDLIMYLASIGVMHNVIYTKGFDEVMLKHSQFIPMGLYNPDPQVLNPIIYTHILISDEGAKEFSKYLADGRRLVPIKHMIKEGNLPALLNTLVEVKGGNTNE